MLKRTVLLCAGLLALALPGAEISPKVVSTAQGKADFVITLTDQELAGVNDRAVLRIISDDRTMPDGSTASSTSEFFPLPYKIEEGKIRLTLPVGGEAERTVQLVFPADKKENRKAKDKVLFSVVFSALDPDLFALHPYKGDFHAHSQVSDGKYTPFAVGANGRRVGLDFFALTDHRKREGSAEMVREFKPYQLNYLPIHGEEFHSGNAVVHSLAFGHEKGVHEWINANQEEFDRLIAEAEKKLTGYKLSDFERHQVASAQVLYRKAREFGAELVIFCHPYWRPNGRFNGPPRYTDAMLDLGEFDALEMPNGTGGVNLSLTVDRVLDKAREGKNFRFVGVSDSHDTANPNFGKTYTVAFAKDLSVNAVADAVKTGNSVTVYAADVKNPLVLGPWRQARYAYFLLDNYYPEHDEICRKQGELLLNAANGKPYDSAAMEALNRELEALNARTWAR